MISKIFSELNLTNIKETNTQYRFNCLYCNDKKFRGNLYKENYHYHCYSCNIHKNLIQILDDKNIFLDKTIYTDILTIINKENLFRIDDELINDVYSKGINKKEFFKKYHLINADIDIRSIRFLKNNLLFKLKDKFAYNSLKKHIYLLNIKNNIIIGYVILNLRNFGKPEKLTGLIGIYDELKLNNTITQTQDIISKIINILELDLNQTITIFDDVVNSLLMNNSIYLVNNKYIFDTYNKQYYYANNNHGLLLFNEKLLEKEKVFNWKTFLYDNNIKNKIYDLHDLIKYQKKSNNKLFLTNYFINT